jgi:Fe-S cluster assembly protein SufB
LAEVEFGRSAEADRPADVLRHAALHGAHKDTLLTTSVATRTAALTKDYQYGFSDPEQYSFKSRRGLDRDVVEQISAHKQEPEWMLQFRLRALNIFQRKPVPTWPSADLSEIDFDNIFYYLRPTDNSAEKNWDDVPPYIKDTFDKLGIPEAERKFLAGVSAQYESEVVYHSIRKDLEKQGVIFLDMDSGLRQYPELVKEYFATVIPAADNKFSALNSAVWSGGSFIYVPKNTHVEMPLQAYFRINAENMGQFERTLIIADEGSRVHYIEGCTAPTYSSDSLHSAVVELIAKPGAHIRYTTIQNWSNNVYNLVTKRAVAYEDATVEWVDGNLGSKVTIKYPAVYLLGRGARADILSVAFAGAGQHQDAGGKVIHVAPDTTSTITSKSISKDGGQATYRGLLKVAKGAVHAKSFVRCDALLLDEQSRSNTYPSIEIDEEQADIGHEATVSRLSDEQVFYLQTRGLTETEAKALIVNGFFDQFTKELPMEYAVELNRLITLQMEGSIG